MARIGVVGDIPECYALHESLGLPYTKRSWHILPQLWRILLSERRLQLFLVENRSRPIGSRIVAFGAVVFVTDEFCAQARLTPYVGVELTRRYLLKRLPVLSRAKAARANAGNGLNVIMCYEGWAQDGLSAEQFITVRGKQKEAFHLALRGYHVKEFLAALTGEETKRWMLDAGARLRREYSSYFQKNSIPESDGLRRPCLLGLTRKEAFAHPGSSVAGLFIYTPPRFRFNRSQRKLLRHALRGETCEQVALSLSVSPWTVKKRWRAIYDRVADVDSELLPPAIAYGSDVLSRGMERRRHLLNYLRQHLEELRPFESPQADGSKS